MEDVRGWTPADREKIQNRVRARKKTVLSHIEAGDVEEYERKVLNKRANAIINPMPSASRAVGRVKETHAEAVVSSKAKTSELPLTVMLTPLRPLRPSTDSTRRPQYPRRRYAGPEAQHYDEEHQGARQGVAEGGVARGEATAHLAQKRM